MLDVRQIHRAILKKVQHLVSQGIYRQKLKKQVRFYVNLGGVDTFPNT